MDALKLGVGWVSAECASVAVAVAGEVVVVVHGSHLYTGVTASARPLSVLHRAASPSLFPGARMSLAYAAHAF